MASRRATGGRRRRLRGHPLRIAMLALALVLVLIGGAAAGYLAWVNRQIDDIPRIDAGLEGGDRAADRPGQPINVLVVGVEGTGSSSTSLGRALTLPKYPGGFRSDTMMILRIAADRRSAQAISIPRDSWVRLPGCEKYADQLDDCHAKLNAAFSLGGPKETVATISQLTDVPISHFAALDLDGFQQLSSDLGGVRVYVPETVSDPISGVTWKQGWTVVRGERALQYVRMRYNLEGGDFDRIARQQNFLRAMVSKLSDKVRGGDPVAMTRAVSTITGQLVIDEGWSTGEIRDLAVSMRSVRPDSVDFYTIRGVPGRAGAQSIVEVEPRQVRAAFAALQDGTVSEYARENPDVLRELAGDRGVN